MPPNQERLRLAELLASISLATDLGTGQPLGHGMRSCQLALAIAQEMGCNSSQIRSVFQVSLLRFLGCTADAAETARTVGGDDIGFNAAMSPVLMGGNRAKARAIMGSVAHEEPLLRRGRLALSVMIDARAAADGLAAHCEVAAMLSQRLNLDDEVVTALQHAYERWDGRGYPNGVRGEDIPLEVRVCTVARDVDLLATAGDDTVDMLRQRRGKGYDPHVVDAWMNMRPRHVEADWDSLMAAEPKPFAYTVDREATLTALADFVDLKSPWTRGHSRSVAQLARQAAEAAGIEQAEVNRVGGAGLVHDLGRVGVANGVWDKPGALSSDEWEEVMLHPYLTSRILGRCPSLSDLGALAASHHERLDGSGYHGQASGSQLSTSARILAAADVYVALRSDRPHRPAFDRDEAFGLLGVETAAGRLDVNAVACVTAAVDGDLRRAAFPNPDGLTDREVEVLRHISSGLTNRQVAETLYLSVKTVGRHVENIYAKIGVSTRAGAAVYAMDHSLLS